MYTNGQSSHLLQYIFAKLMSLTKVRLLIILEKLFTLFTIRHPIGRKFHRIVLPVRHLEPWGALPHIRRSGMLIGKFEFNS